MHIHTLLSLSICHFIPRDTFQLIAIRRLLMTNIFCTCHIFCITAHQPHGPRIGSLHPDIKFTYKYIGGKHRELIIRPISRSVLLLLLSLRFCGYFYTRLKRNDDDKDSIISCYIHFGLDRPKSVRRRRERERDRK